MTSRLVWAAGDPSRGQAVRDELVVTLGNPPDLGFAFDSLWRDGARTEKSVGGLLVALDADEIAACDAYLAQLADFNQEHLVWGVDADGIPLGLVPESSAFAISPPQPSGSYRWSFATESWVPR